MHMSFGSYMQMASVGRYIYVWYVWRWRWWVVLQNDYCYTVLLMLLLLLISQFEMSFQLFFALQKVPSLSASYLELMTSFLLKCFAISESVFHMFSSLKGEWEYKKVSLFTTNAYSIVHKSPTVPIAHTHGYGEKKQRMRFAERVKQNNANDWSKPKKTQMRWHKHKSKEKERVHKMGG